MGVRVVAGPGADDPRRARRGPLGPPGPAGDGAADADLDASAAGMLDHLSGWLRGVLWCLGPVAPGSAASAPGLVEAEGVPGAAAELTVRTANRQAAAVSVVLEPSPLRSARGDVWFPEVLERRGVTIPAGEERTIELVLAVPAELPPGAYAGTLRALEMAGDALELRVDVLDTQGRPAGPPPAAGAGER